MFSRDFRRPKRAKVKYILGLGLSWCVSSCPLGAGGALLLPLFGCVPSLSPCLCPLSCFACRVACEYGFISRFKGVSSAFWGADVCLYRLRSLRGLWGFCVREWLGGYMACGVFAPIFSFFHLLRLSSRALPLLSSACPLVCLVCSCVIVGFVFSFSLTDVCAKRKGAKCFCVLSCPVVCISLSDLFNILGKI